jgi:hypothetical protein
MRGAERFEMPSIKIELPTVETKGYWRRVKRAAALRVSMTAGMTPEVCDEVIEFLLPFVIVPTDRDEAREILFDASQTEFEKMMQAFHGGGNNTSVPPQNSAPSENTTSQG